MSKDFVRVEPIALLPTPAGCAIFLGDGHKVIMFYIEPSIGLSINSVLSGKPAPRPLTHDLFSQVLQAFGGKLTRMLITNVEEEVFYAKLILEGENEIQDHKIVEVDARPSDGIALAVRAEAPIYVVADVWSALDDKADLLEDLNREAGGSSEMG